MNKTFKINGKAEDLMGSEDWPESEASLLFETLRELKENGEDNQYISEYRARQLVHMHRQFHREPDGKILEERFLCELIRLNG